MAYSYPLPREAGKPDAAGSSSRRSQRGHLWSRPSSAKTALTGSGNSGFIADLEEIQTWLDLPGKASVLIATVDPALYTKRIIPEAAALEVRSVGQAVFDSLGEEYAYSPWPKPRRLSGAAQAFLAIQALINTYGLISLGIVGLLIYTLMLTNVQEQRRDMAILRILGAQRATISSPW